MPGRARYRWAGGFTYIALLIALAIIAAGLAGTAEFWHTTMQREKEKQLLFIGNEFRNALKSYYVGPPIGRYPQRLEDLLLDDRSPAIRRHLRKIYVDPVTGKAQWGLVTLPDGQIVGVNSLSTDEPLKTAGFLLRDASLEGKTKYSEWVFSYSPPQQIRQTPGVRPTTAGGL